MSATSVLVLGARGQLGVDLMAAFGGAARGADRPEADVTDEAGIRRFLATHRPQLIINCAAWTNVEQAEQDTAKTFEVNAVGALNVARAATEVGANLIYISTDYVFGADADRRCPYVESDCPGPINVYGASKLAGEQLTRAASSHSLVVRTSGLYGHGAPTCRRGNFVETILRMAHSGKPLRVVADQQTTPTSTRALASAIAKMASSPLTGVVHLASRDSCSWHEFATAIVELAGLPVDVSPIPAAEYPARARRPAFSVLATERGDLPDSPPMPPWRDMLTEYLQSRGEVDESVA